MLQGKPAELHDKYNADWVPHLKMGYVGYLQVDQASGHCHPLQARKKKQNQDIISKPSHDLPIRLI